ncbi:MAG: FitA-like ribbon-helix-helix domain-containing protein [Thermochromatium sp.]
MDDTTKTALRVQAAQHGVSMEEEVRRILRDALVRTASPSALGQRLMQRFAAAASEDFVLPERHPPRAASLGVPMLLLNTNVLSEFMRLRPAEVVIAWL